MTIFYLSFWQACFDELAIRLLLCWQLKCYSGSKSKIGFGEINKEIERTKRHLAGFREHVKFAGVCLVYLVVGFGVSKKVKDAMGRLYSKGEHKSLVVPAGLHVIIPSEEQVTKFLGAKAMDAFRDLHARGSCVEPSELEKLAKLFGELDGDKGVA
jgi:hypothetical protein